MASALSKSSTPNPASLTAPAPAPAPASASASNVSTPLPSIPPSSTAAITTNNASASPIPTTATTSNGSSTATDSLDIHMVLSDDSSLKRLKAMKMEEKKRYEERMKELDSIIKRKEIQDTGDKCVKILEYHKQLCDIIQDNHELWRLHKLMCFYEDAKFEKKDASEAKQLFDEYYTFVLRGDHDADTKAKLEAKHVPFFNASTHSVSSTHAATSASAHKRKRDRQSEPNSDVNDKEIDNDSDDAPSSLHHPAPVIKKSRNNQISPNHHPQTNRKPGRPPNAKPQSSSSSSSTRPSTAATSRATTPSSSSRTVAAAGRTSGTVRVTIRIGPHVADRKRPQRTSTFKLKYDIPINIDVNIQRTVDDVLILIWTTLGNRVVSQDNNKTSMEIVNRESIQFNLYRDDPTSRDEDPLLTSTHDMVDGGTYLLCPTSTKVDVFVCGDPTSDSFQIAYTLLKGKPSIEDVEHQLMLAFGREKAKFGVVVKDTVHEVRVTKLNILHSTVCAVRDKLRPGRKSQSSLPPKLVTDENQQQRQQQKHVKGDQEDGHEDSDDDDHSHDDDGDGDHSDDDDGSDHGEDDDVMEIVKAK